MRKLFVSLALSLSIALPLSAVAQENLGCSSAVVLNGGTIEVTSSDASDTDNIQCALDAAVSGGYRDVFLVSSEYQISGLSTKGFVGDLRGTSKAATLVTVADESLVCDGAPGVAMEFVVGNVGIRNMSIAVAHLVSPDRRRVWWLFTRTPIAARPIEQRLVTWTGLLCLDWVWMARILL